MDDIEDMAKSAYPGFHQPRELRSGVAIGPRRASTKQPGPADPDGPPLELASSAGNVVPGVQTIYVKTFGCSHNQSDSEYMAGQLSAYGYDITEVPAKAHLWLINTCTVKNPSQSAMETLIRTGKDLKKPLVIAGCVPQGDSRLKDLDGISIVGVQQIDRVVEVVEETLKGHEVRLLRRRTLPSLDLPKVRKNRYVEIVPINVGCLGACTYCKTKHARGHLGSYPISSLVDRVRSVIADGVKEIWLSSEDTGAYGRDLGTDLPHLLRALISELPEDRSTMLRIGMTNPPYILQHLEAIAEILRHPCVYAFLHVPVQSGSDAVLNAMRREYSVADFRQVADTLIRLVPGIHIATDIICGFPGETVEDFEQTIRLIEDYEFAEVHISQFYPRPGTPAARMKKVPTFEVKKRSRRLTSIFEGFSPFKGMEGEVERVWVTDIASDGIHLVGHTKSYAQVLLPAGCVPLGSNHEVKISSVGRWSVMGEPLCSKSDVPVNQLSFWKRNSFVSRIRNFGSSAATNSDGCACSTTVSKRFQTFCSGGFLKKQHHQCTPDQSNVERSSTVRSTANARSKEGFVESARYENSQNQGHERDDTNVSDEVASGITKLDNENVSCGSTGKLARQRGSQSVRRVKASRSSSVRIGLGNDESMSLTGERGNPLYERLAVTTWKKSRGLIFLKGRWSRADWTFVCGILAGLVATAAVIFGLHNFQVT